VSAPPAATTDGRAKSSAVKVRVEIDQTTTQQRHLLGVIEMARLPIVGELFGSNDTTYEVVQAVHTPSLHEYDALVVLRKRLQ